MASAEHLLMTLPIRRISSPPQLGPRMVVASHWILVLMFFACENTISCTSIACDLFALPAFLFLPRMPCRRTWRPREQFPQSPSGQQGAGQDVYQQNSGDSQKWRAVSRIHEESIHAVSRALEQHCGEDFKDCWPHQRPKQRRIEGNDSRVLEESRDPESEPGYCQANQQFPSH